MPPSEEWKRVVVGEISDPSDWARTHSDMMDRYGEYEYLPKLICTVIDIRAGRVWYFATESLEAGQFVAADSQTVMVVASGIHQDVQWVELSKPLSVAVGDTLVRPPHHTWRPRQV